MADRPIIFSAPMIAALLAGRKTQTRRILKPQPRPFTCEGRSYWSAVPGIGGRIFVSDADLLAAHRWCVGDRLYVRENHALVPSSAYRMSEGVQQTINPGDRDEAAIYAAGWERSKPRWRPSIHMPRWASRLTLLVTDVRVERLNDISEGDAAAEGVELESADPPFHYVPGIWPHSITAVGVEEPGGRHAARSFAKLWGHINGPESWQANPWVVAVTFTVHARNIDQLAPIVEAAE